MIHRLPPPRLPLSHCTHCTGIISLNGTDASHVAVDSTVDGQDLSIGVNGATDSHLLLHSSGSSTDALHLRTGAGWSTVCVCVCHGALLADT